MNAWALALVVVVCLLVVWLLYSFVVCVRQKNADWTMQGLYSRMTGDDKKTVDKFETPFFEEPELASDDTKVGYLHSGETIDPDQIENRNWSDDVVQSIGLEPSVIEEHRRYTNNAQRRTTGVSMMSVREADAGPNKFVGLRRTRYEFDLVGSDARVVPSEVANSGHLADVSPYILH